MPDMQPQAEYPELRPQRPETAPEYSMKDLGKKVEIYEGRLPQIYEALCQKAEYYDKQISAMTGTDVSIDERALAVGEWEKGRIEAETLAHETQEKFKRFFAAASKNVH